VGDGDDVIARAVCFAASTQTGFVVREVAREVLGVGGEGQLVACCGSSARLSSQGGVYMPGMLGQAGCKTGDQRENSDDHTEQHPEEGLALESEVSSIRRQDGVESVAQASSATRRSVAAIHLRCRGFPFRDLELLVVSESCMVVHFRWTRHRGVRQPNFENTAAQGFGIREEKAFTGPTCCTR